MFNPVGYLLPTVYLFMAYVANPDLFVCVCRTWMCLDITRFYEEQRQPSSGSEGGFDTICTAVCIRCDSYTAGMLCLLEPFHIVHLCLQIVIM